MVICTRDKRAAPPLANQQPIAGQPTHALPADILPPPSTPLAVCGIFGYYNHGVPRSRREILECLLTGLRRLEYRGYDSAGICVDAQPLSSSSCPKPGSGAEDAPAGNAADGADGGPGGPRCCAAALLL